MNLETALAALRTAGYTFTPAGSQGWRLQLGQGSQATDTLVSSAELVALVERHVQPSNPAAGQPLDLPQTVAMLRAAGLTVEPVGPGYWQVVVADGDRTLAQLFAAERLLQMGNIVATAVPGLIREQHPYWQQQQQTFRPVDPTETCYTLAQLGWATSDDLARLCFYDGEELAAALYALAQEGRIVPGPEETWMLAPAGWEEIAHLLPPGIATPPEQDLPHPQLAMVVARLIDDLRPLQLSRLELLAPGLGGPLAGSRGRSLLLTVTPEPRGIAWTRNLAAQAADGEMPVLHIAIELLEADRATSTALTELLTLLRTGETPAPLLPCLVTSDPWLAAVVQAEIRNWRPTGPWMVSSLAAAMEGRWTTAPSGRLEVDLGLALRQARR